MDMLHVWMVAQRDPVPESSAPGKAPDYSLKRWAMLFLYLDNGAVPIDNNWTYNEPGDGLLDVTRALRRITTPRKTGAGDKEFDPACEAEWK